MIQEFQGQKSGSTSVLKGDEKVGASYLALRMAEYAEAARNKELFCLTTPFAGFTILAAGLAVNPMFAGVNPAGSGVDMIILASDFTHISGTPTAGPVGLWLSPGMVLGTGATDSLENVGVSSCYGAAGKPQSKNYTGVANLVSSITAPVPKFLMEIANQIGTPANTLQAGFKELKGLAVVPPGCGYIINPSGAGTTWIVSSRIWFQEVPSLT